MMSGVFVVHVASFNVIMMGMSRRVSLCLWGMFTMVVMRVILMMMHLFHCISFFVSRERAKAQLVFQ